MKLIKYGLFNVVDIDEASCKETDPRGYELASSLKNMCNVKMPQVTLVSVTLL